MSIKLMKRAIELYSSQTASKAQNRYNQRAWLKAIDYLGDKMAICIKVPLNKQSVDNVLNKHYN